MSIYIYTYTQPKHVVCLYTSMSNPFSEEMHVCTCMHISIHVCEYVIMHVCVPEGMYACSVCVFNALFCLRGFLVFGAGEIGGDISTQSG